jgi:hypothetical protein
MGPGAAEVDVQNVSAFFGREMCVRRGGDEGAESGFWTAKGAVWGGEGMGWRLGVLGG